MVPKIGILQGLVTIFSQGSTAASWYYLHRQHAFRVHTGNNSPNIHPRPVKIHTAIRLAIWQRRFYSGLMLQRQLCIIARGGERERVGFLLQFIGDYVTQRVWHWTPRRPIVLEARGNGAGAVCWVLREVRHSRRNVSLEMHVGTASLFHGRLRKNNMQSYLAGVFANAITSNREKRELHF